MIQKIKNDFNNVRGALCLWLNREIPLWICIVYYMLMLPIGLLLYPFAMIWLKIELRKLDREIKALEAEWEA